MLAQLFFIIVVHTVYLTYDRSPKYSSKNACASRYFLPVLTDCLQPCLRISGTGRDGELGSLALKWIYFFFFFCSTWLS